MNEIKQMVDQVLELSPPVLLAVMLNIVGLLLKRSPIANWLIPWILIAMGGITFPFICDRQTVVYNAYSPTAYTVIVGCCIGGLAVGLYEGVAGFLDSRKPKEGSIGGP